MEVIRVEFKAHCSTVAEQVYCNRWQKTASELLMCCFLCTAGVDEVFHSASSADWPVTLDRSGSGPVQIEIWLSTSSAALEKTKGGEAVNKRLKDEKLKPGFLSTFWLPLITVLWLLLLWCLQIRAALGWIVTEKPAGVCLDVVPPWWLICHQSFVRPRGFMEQPFRNVSLVLFRSTKMSLCATPWHLYVPDTLDIKIFIAILLSAQNETCQKTFRTRRADAFIK